MNAKPMTRAQAATLALSVFLNNTSVDQIVDALIEVRRTFRLFEPENDLENCAPLILLTGALLQRTTGIFVMTEDTADKWLKEAEEIAATEFPAHPVVLCTHGTKKL